MAMVMNNVTTRIAVYLMNRFTERQDAD